MNQQTKSTLDTNKKQVTLPPTPTKRVDRATRKRELQLQLQQQSTDIPNNQRYSSATSTISSPPRNNIGYRRRRRRAKVSFKKLFNVKFFRFLIGLLLIGLGLKSLINTNQPVQQQSIQPSIPKPLYSPSTPPVWTADSQILPTRQLGRENIEVLYNLKTPPEFKHNQQLQTIVNDVVNFAAAEGFSTEPLSITLINAKTGEIAGYHQVSLKYPASVVKMFWMVFLYAQMESGIWLNKEGFYPYISKMVQDSENDATSFIIDKSTDTKFVKKLNDEELQIWRNKRNKPNQFFQQAGYQGINISHKTYPIYSLNLTAPKGSELQIRYNPNQPDTPLRNQITTDHAARLLYEICYLKQAISPEASQQMCGWLKRDLNPEVWKQQSNGFNPIIGFLGQSLSDTNIYFYSKAGWTEHHRHEAALVATPDNETIYILAVFADDEMYAKDWKIFPKMSRFVYDRMTQK